MRYLATTGIGTINASLVLATLAASIEFDAVFFSGTSGGIDDRLKIGDVVVATETFDADIFSIHDAVIGTPFETALTNPNKKEKELKFHTSAKRLSQAIKNDKWRFGVFHGRIATSNHFPSPADLFEKIKEKNAMVIDMESTAIYQFSWLSGLPCLVVRGVSNLLDSEGTDENVADSDVSSSDHAAMIVLDCIESITKTNIKSASVSP